MGKAVRRRSAAAAATELVGKTCLLVMRKTFLYNSMCTRFVLLAAAAVTFPVCFLVLAPRLYYYCGGRLDNDKWNTIAEKE